MRRNSGKGLPPELASYFTDSDHRRQIEAAATRREKRKVAKLRRRLDRDIIEDDLLPNDVSKAKHSKNFTGNVDRTRRNFN